VKECDAPRSALRILLRFVILIKAIWNISRQRQCTPHRRACTHLDGWTILLFNASIFFSISSFSLSTMRSRRIGIVRNWGDFDIKIIFLFLCWRTVFFTFWFVIKMSYSEQQEVEKSDKLNSWTILQTPGRLCQSNTIPTIYFPFHNAASRHTDTETLWSRSCSSSCRLVDVCRMKLWRQTF